MEWDDQAPADDEGQLSASDTLEDRGLDDALDEGYSPPEHIAARPRSGPPRPRIEQGGSLDPRAAGVVETAARERGLEVAAGAPEAGERAHLVDGGVQRRRVRAKALECQRRRHGPRAQERVRIVQRQRRQRARERVRARQRDGLSRAERIIADDAHHEVRERGEVGLPE